MPLPQFQYFVPETLDEAFSLLQELGEEARVLAGGTDLLVKMKQRAIEPMPKHLINIKKIPGLQYLQADGHSGLRLGALANIQEIKSFLPIRQRFPGLGQAAAILSTPQVRNIATIGGNLCNASPAAETAPALSTLSAKVKIVGKGRERIVPLGEFFLGPGKTVLQSDEILTEIQVPDPPPNSTSVYLKHGKRLSDIAIVGVGLSLRMEGNRCADAKIVLASAGPTPMRVKKAEALMIGEQIGEKLIEEVGKKVSEESRPIDDLRGHADYRREKAGLLAKEAIKQALQQIKLGGS
jgi:aerobic carbon-monoxide dehydrogenase medium subunit